MEQKHNLGSLLNGGVNETRSEPSVQEIAQTQVNNFMAGSTPTATASESTDSSTIMQVTEEDFKMQFRLLQKMQTVRQKSRLSRT